MKEFIYKLQLFPKLWKGENWTSIEQNIISEHFRALVELKKKGRLIMAGKTDAEDETGFGIVIFKTENKEEATAIMQRDPAVVKGLMNAELQEFSIALIKESNLE